MKIGTTHHQLQEVSLNSDESFRFYKNFSLHVHGLYHITGVSASCSFAVMGDTAAITLLTNALKALAPNPSTTLNPPTFDWNSTEQYSDFQLFTKSVKSWFTLQNIVKEEKEGSTEVNSTRLEYVLNFLGNTGCKKYERWQPSGAKDEVKEGKC